MQEIRFVFVYLGGVIVTSFHGIV